MDKDEAEEGGLKIFTIDLSQRNTTPAEVDRKLEQFIRENDGGKYVFSLEYDDDIPYGQYIETVDMVFRVVYRFRDEMAMKEHNVGYLDLGKGLQKEIRKTYPMVLSEAWSN
jgi:endo-alpha-1,4-polygalactosaminidase (GH114 family)